MHRANPSVYATTTHPREWPPRRHHWLGRDPQPGLSPDLAMEADGPFEESLVSPNPLPSGDLQALVATAAGGEV
jgi:hypothetical protein